MSTLKLAVAAAGWFLVGSPAARADTAPVCADGRLMNEDTKGQCCWPDQVWSTMRRVCVGIPRCPYGMHPEGEQCVPGFPSAQAPLPTPPERPHRSLPPAGAYPVLFDAYHQRHRYTISMDGANCETPCRLFVRTGEQRLTALSGSQDIHKSFVIPAAPSRIVLLHGMHDTVIAGTVLLTLSTAMMLAGNLALYSDSQQGLILASVFGWSIGPVTHLAGIITLAVGVARLRHANLLQPYSDPYAASRKRRPQLLSADVAPTGNGIALGVTLRY